MTFTHDEKRLFSLYNSGSAPETTDILRDALNDISDLDERSTVEGLLRKLEEMNGTEFDNLSSESGC